MRKILPLLLSLSLLAATQTLARAQASAYAETAAIDTSAFPRITALVDVFAANGEFMQGLKPSDMTVYEDGKQRPVDTLIQASVPAQIVVAVNPGPALAVRDGTGVTRFTRVVEALGNWANTQPDDSQDDLSLVSLSGSLISHGVGKGLVRQPGFLQARFPQHNPQPADPFHRAGYGQHPVTEPGMKRAILFITPHMDDPNIDNTIAPFIQQAIDTQSARLRLVRGCRELVQLAQRQCVQHAGPADQRVILCLFRQGGIPRSRRIFRPLRHIYS